MLGNTEVCEVARLVAVVVAVVVVDRVSLDLAAVELVHLLREFKSSSRDYQSATQVVNTEESTSYGYHWFTVALSMRRRRV